MNESNVTQAFSYCKYHQPPSDTERAVKLTGLSIVGLFGMIGNIFTIVLAAKYTVRRNLHFLIINMAVSDTLVIICALLTAIIETYFNMAELSLKSELYIAAILRCTVGFVWDTSETVSLVTLVIISIQRYRITRRRAVYIGRPYSVKQRLCLIFGSWLISTTITLNAVIFNYPGKDGKCYIKSHFFNYVWFTASGILKIAIFLVILLISILTLRRLSSQQAIEDNLSEAQRKLRRRRIGSAVKMILYSLLLYCCCFTPYLVFSLLWYLNLFPSIDLIKWNTCLDWYSFNYVVVYFLPIVNCSFSPCVYFICLSDFRQAAKTALCRGNTTDD